MKFMSGQDQLVGHAAVSVNTEHLQHFATIGFSKAARVTSSAIQVGLDTAMIPHFEVGDVAAHSKNLDAQFVAENPWVLNEGHFAQITTQISSAKTNGTDAHQCFVRAWRRRFG
jgi:hypothetical protein